MSISPISASSLYQEQINYFLAATRTDYNSVSNLLAQFGVKSTGDAQKDLAKLQEIQKKTAIEAKQSLSEDETASASANEPVSYIWYSIMYQLGLDPTGSPQKDFQEIMTEIVDRIQGANSESEYNKYMGLIALVEDLFIASGVKISDIPADSLSAYQSMELLANYNKASLDNA